MTIMKKTCNKCSEEKPLEDFHNCSKTKDGKKNVCKTCRNEANRLRQKGYYAKNKERINAQSQAWKDANRDKVRATRNAWKAANQEEHKKYIREWHKANPEKCREYKRAWKKRNPEKAKEDYERYMKFKREAIGSFTQQEWQALVEKYDYSCLCCLEVKPLTVDHVVPLSLGGTNFIDNIQPLCMSCNSRKGQQVIDYRLEDDYVE